MKETTLSVSAIKEGTVIDHITAGNGLKIIRLLGLMEEGRKVTLGLNLKSASMGTKDLIKIEKRFLEIKDTEQIAVFAPLATVNVIENYVVSKKFSVSMPRSVKGILQCPNPQCITKKEEISSFFLIEERDPEIFFQCHFCEKIFSQKEMKERI